MRETLVCCPYWQSCWECSKPIVVGDVEDAIQLHCTMLLVMGSLEGWRAHVLRTNMLNCPHEWAIPGFQWPTGLWPWLPILPLVWIISRPWKAYPRTFRHQVGLLSMKHRNLMEESQSCKHCKAAISKWLGIFFSISEKFFFGLDHIRLKRGGSGVCVHGMTVHESVGPIPARQGRFSALKGDSSRWVCRGNTEAGSFSPDVIAEELCRH